MRYNSALENEALCFEHLFQYYNNRVIISSENKHLNFINGSDIHLRSITGTCSTKDNGVESHNQSVSNVDDKASDNPDIPLGDNGSMNNTSDINDCISIDSDLNEGVASLSNSSVYNNVNSNDNLLRFVCLNCCGFKTRLQYPEFRNLIQSYEIICFVETKTDNIDIIILPGYKFVMKNRETNTKNRSGGIMVGFKDNLAKHIDLVNTDSKYVMWFKCSEQPFKTDQPVFVGVVYIPPEYTKYSSEDAFSELQQQYLSSSNTSKYICLLGDFNARTATDTDFVDLIKNRNVDDYITDFVDNFTNILNDLKMPLNRIIIVTFLQRKQYIYS
jgi:hypothetical protein